VRPGRRAGGRKRKQGQKNQAAAEVDH
jgi:hypothetical protein